MPDNLSSEKSQSEQSEMQEPINLEDLPIEEKTEIKLTTEQEVIKEEIIHHLKRGDLNLAEAVQRKHGLPEELFKDPEIKELIEESIIKWLPSGQIFAISACGRRFDSSGDVFKSPKVQQASKEELVDIMVSSRDNDKISLAENTKSALYLSEELYEQAIEESIAKLLLKGEVAEATDVSDCLNLSEEAFLERAKRSLINNLTIGKINEVLKVKNTLSIPMEFFESSGTNEAIQSGIIIHLLHNDFKSAFEIRDNLNVSVEIFSKSVERSIIEGLSSGQAESIKGAVKIKDDIDMAEGRNADERVYEKKLTNSELSSEDFEEMRPPRFDDNVQELRSIKLSEGFFKSPEVIAAIKKAMLDYYLPKENFYSGFLEFKQHFDIPLEIIKSPEIVQAAKQRIFASVPLLEEINDIKEEFGIEVSIQEIMNEFPNITEMVSKLEELAPGFRNQVLKSEDLLFGLFNFRENPEGLIELIKENPFLAKAIERNPKFATKLIIKYPQFDELSKENIGLLFNTKEEILTANPDIDPNSIEFRELVQEKLKTYKLNPDIIKFAQEKGVGVEEWLDYPEVKYFQLGEEDEVPFSEVVATPIGRVNETVGMYAKTIKEKLKEYKLELSEFKVPLEDSQEIEEKINQMRVELERARAESNDKKVKGIEKGIEGLNKKKERSVSLWNKLVGDIDAFKILKDGVSNANETLKKVEENLKTELAKERPVAKEVKKLKKQASELKEELRGKFKVLEGRVGMIRYNLINLISPALGIERAQSIYQEIHTELEEQFSHYDTDRSTLSNLFSEKENDKKNKLENQPMSISVWSRNPDVDLYQGNYSPCCICIESGHMGAECTIADYATDLGIQIVNIWDESENKPVVAAWCWLGVNKNGEVALVVDNIEANTLYSNSYPEQLTQQLFEYLENYAKKVGVKKVVLGTANNDLPTSVKLGELQKDKKYKKLGGYNREDGYFLEAEKDSVKIVWEGND